MENGFFCCIAILGWFLVAVPNYQWWWWAANGITWPPLNLMYYVNNLLMEHIFTCPLSWMVFKQIHCLRVELRSPILYMFPVMKLLRRLSRTLSPLEDLKPRYTIWYLLLLLHCQVPTSPSIAFPKLISYTTMVLFWNMKTKTWLTSSFCPTLWEGLQLLEKVCSSMKFQP